MKQNNTKLDLLELLGWIGVVCIISSYCLLAIGLIDGRSLIYHGLILLGALFVALISYKKRNFQPVVMNIIFAVLALFALIRLILIP